MTVAAPIPMSAASADEARGGVGCGQGRPRSRPRRALSRAELVRPRKRLRSRPCRRRSSLALHAKAPVSGRIRGNLWATAQFIESRRHRKTLTALMTGIFQAPAAPTALHRRLAGWRAAADRGHLVRRRDASRAAGQRTDRLGRDSRRHPRGRVSRDLDAGLRCVRRTGRSGRRRELDHDPLQAARCHHAGGKFPRVGFRLCRGADRDRYSDANSGRREGAAPGMRLSVHRRAVSRTDVAYFRAADRQTFGGRSSGRLPSARC